MSRLQSRPRQSNKSGPTTHEIIPNRLYYVALTRKPQDTSNALYFTTDNTLVYWNFFLDFGPLNLGQTYRFCELLNRLLAAPEHKNKVIYYYSSTHSHRRTNSVTLMTAWALIYLGRTPEEAFAPFEDAYPAFPPFHDASPCVCSYKLTIRTSPTPPFPSLPLFLWTCYYLFIFLWISFLKPNIWHGSLLTFLLLLLLLLLPSSLPPSSSSFLLLSPSSPCLFLFFVVYSSSHSRLFTWY